MSNERIDLTQFEGIGEWKVLEYWDEEEARYEIRTGRDNHSKHEAEVIAKLPNLIAELKRCYEELDMAESALTEIWAHQIDNVGGYNVTEILLYYEKAHGLNIKPNASE